MAREDTAGQQPRQPPFLYHTDRYYCHKHYYHKHLFLPARGTHSRLRSGLSPSCAHKHKYCLSTTSNIVPSPERPWAGDNYQSTDMSERASSYPQGWLQPGFLE